MSGVCCLGVHPRPLRSALHPLAENLCGFKSTAMLQAAGHTQSVKTADAVSPCL